MWIDLYASIYSMPQPETSEYDNCKFVVITAWNKAMAYATEVTVTFVALKQSEAEFCDSTWATAKAPWSN